MLNNSTRILYLLCFLLNIAKAKSQPELSDTLLLRVGQTGYDVFKVVNSSDSTLIIAFTEDEDVQGQVHVLNQVRIVCLNKRGELLWTKKMKISPEERILSMELQNGNLIFLSQGINKLTYTMNAQNNVVSIIKYFDLKTEKISEYYFDDKPVGIIKGNTTVFVLNKEQGCKTKYSRIYLSSMSKTSDGLVKVMGKAPIDNILCGRSNLANSFIYFEKNKKIEYIKFDMEPKPGTDPVGMKTSINMNDHVIKYDYVTIDVNSKKRVMKNICTNCYYDDFKVINQDLSLLTGKDSAGKQLYFYYPKTSKIKAANLAATRGVYNIHPGENEALITENPGAESYTYIKNDQVVWTKKKEFSLWEKPYTLTCYFTKTEIIVLYILHTNGKTKGELRKFILKK
ncbi:MAG: hypothetical protein K0S33_1141 [Bacteroidetes bacterium]|jgi:hypothetical protein|nr:hypothetical protein [Bacteroidota bacterium]